MKALTVCSALAILSFSAVTFAVPPECREPNAPPGCFHLKYKLVPIEECAEAPIFDPETNRVTYPCGFKVVKNPRKIINDDVSSNPSAKSAIKKVMAPAIQPKYVSSTIRDNGDGTSTIDHGGDAKETINTADAGKTVKDYGEKGIVIHSK